MRKMNVAVIGAGYWGKKIVSEYAQLTKNNSGVSLHSVCDLSKENLTLCELSFQVPIVTTHHKEIMACPEIDAVHICTPNASHYEICKEALEAGKHVLVEKPMSLNSGEALKLVDLAHAKNRVLSVGHIFRFNKALEKVRSLVEEHFFGDLFWLKLQWTTLMPPMEGRDIITDLAPHPFDILNFLLGTWPLKITCKAKAYRREKLEEMAYIIAEFQNDIVANIELSWLTPGKTREVSVMGSKRFVKVDCLTQEVTAFENGNSYNIPVERNNTIEAELKHFLMCIQNNRASKNEYSNQNGGLLGARIVKLLEVTRRSVEEERTELVEW
jgi:UDP-N-acetylglucosamine 3-dehydrogenase